MAVHGQAKCMWGAALARRHCGLERHACLPRPLHPCCRVCPQLVFTVCYALAYLAYLRRAFGDHSQLPFCHYRLSNMYIRIMVRYMTSNARHCMIPGCLRHAACARRRAPRQWWHLRPWQGAAPPHADLAPRLPCPALLPCPAVPPRPHLLLHRHHLYGAAAAHPLQLVLELR